MARRTQRGFTLVELLVVITIIGMLVSLLLPAVNAAREAARRAECQTRLNQLAKAVYNFESSKGYFPGYLNKINGPPALPGRPQKYKRATWIVVLTPYMELNNVWDRWSDPMVTEAIAPTPQVNALLCSSSPRDQSSGIPRSTIAPLAYVANCGKPDFPLTGPPVADRAANGLFINRIATTTKVTAEGIHDGASSTLMLAENIQAFSWVVDPDSEDPPAETLASMEAERFTGFVWDPNEPANPIYMINRDRNIEADPSDAATARPRPSSGHPGGVNAMFADSHSTFLQDSIDYNVYRQLMTPYCDKSDMLDKTYILDSRDYE